MGFLDKFRVPYRASVLVLEGCGAVLGARWRALEGLKGLCGEGAEGELVER